MRFKQVLTLLVLVLAGAGGCLYGQSASWLENTMYQSGKINVVVAVVAVVFIVLIAYLVHLDRKLRKLEEREKLNAK